MNILVGDNQPLSLVTIATTMEEQLTLLIKEAWSQGMVDDSLMEVHDHLFELVMNSLYTSIEVIARENVYQV